MQGYNICAVAGHTVHLMSNPLPSPLIQTAVVGTFIQRVSFSDGDTGANAALTYSITDPVSIGIETIVNIALPCSVFYFISLAEE